MRDAWASFAEAISSDLASESVSECPEQVLPGVLRSAQDAENRPQVSFEDVQAAEEPSAESAVLTDGGQILYFRRNCSYKLQLFGLNDHKIGGRGGIQYFYLGNADLPSVKLRKIFAKHLALKLALLVTGINGDVKDSVSVKQTDRCLNCGHCGLSQGGYSLVTAGQVAQIEHSRLNGCFYVLLNAMMRITDERIIVRTTRAP